MSLRVVVVGASEYKQSEFFAALPGAALDAVWIRRFLRYKGVPESQLTILVGRHATRKQVIAALRSVGDVSTETTPERLIFFYSGHGAALSTPGGSVRHQCVLHTFDTSIKNRIETSISISDLFSAVRRTSSLKEVYFFMDACHLSAGAVSHAFHEELSDRPNLDIFLCIVASNRGLSLEGMTLGAKLGEFSRTLIRNLSDVDDSDRPSAASLVHKVTRTAIQTRLANPAVVSFGNMSLWPFDCLSSGARVSPSDEVPRNTIVLRCIEALQTSQVRNVCLVGGSGAGKSSVIRQLARRLHRCLLVTYPKRQGAFESDEEALLEISETVRITLGKTADDAALGAIPTPWQEALALFENAEPHPILLIDGGENLPDSAWQMLAGELSNTTIDLIATRYDRRLPFLEATVIEMEPMTREQVGHLAKQRGILASDSEIERGFIASGGYPLDFLSLLESPVKPLIPQNLLEAATYVGAAGAVCDASLFEAIVGTSVSDIERLRALGLVLAEEDGILRLHDRAETLDTSLIKWERVAEYWDAELEGRHQERAAKEIIRLVSLGTNQEFFRSGNLAVALRIASPALSSNAISRIISKGLTVGDTAVFIEAVDVLSRRGAIEYLAVLRGYNHGIGSIDARHACDLLLAQARLAWWMGDYEKSRNYAELALDRGNAEGKVASARLEVAISDFFEGKWAQAISALEPIVESRNVDIRTSGWARLILGTCVGIRGRDDGRGRSLLRSAAAILKRARDPAGAAIALGNCGEVGWKSKDFVSAEKELREGISIASALGMTINVIESRRNLIQLYLRSSGVDDKRLLAEERYLISLKTEDIGAMEMMQVSNTLATLALYRHDLEGASSWLAIAEPLTLGNFEYEIYTNGNRAIYGVLRGSEAAASASMTAAVNMSREGENFLALAQLREDVLACLALSHSRQCRLLLSILDQSSGERDEKLHS